MLEIERKYLVEGDFLPDVVRSEQFRQGYISSQSGRTVRIRIAGEKGYLTIKGASPDGGLSRYEYEQELSLQDAEDLFLLCEPGSIEKKRHWAIIDGHTWEIDVFQGANKGLVLAEIELHAPDESFTLPAWIGKEVTGDPRYYNAMLTKQPYKDWEHFLS
ncbi:CYTH domain-containing protein [Parabacteroides sp. OttesenSCG-928-K15]|nr:CYTH domain-containing protein [Parabacteroides sp. OttesenSCG-928-K15]